MASQIAAKSALVGGQGTIDVLQDQGARRATLGLERRDQRPERPERARAGVFVVVARAQALVEPGQGQVLTGEGAPDEIGAAGQLGRFDLGDVAADQVVVTPVGGVDRRLHRVEIVGEIAAPALEAGSRHAAAGEELEEDALRALRSGRRERADGHGSPSESAHIFFLVPLMFR